MVLENDDVQAYYKASQHAYWTGKDVRDNMRNVLDYFLEIGVTTQQLDEVTRPLTSCPTAFPKIGLMSSNGLWRKVKPVQTLTC